MARDASRSKVLRRDLDHDDPLPVLQRRQPAGLRPPPHLRQQVWPDLDGWRAAHLELPSATEKVTPNLAAGGFLELLDRLHDVFLQVSINLFYSM